MSSSQSFRYNGSVLFKCCPGSKGLRFCVTKKYGNAVQRNLFKRRTRSVFNRFVERNSMNNYMLYVTPLKPSVSFQTLQKAFLTLQDNIVNI